MVLTVLLRTYAGRRIRLACDNGRSHPTQAVQQCVADHREQLELYWLPPYCPSLNLIARLWGPLKRTVFANVLYPSLAALVQALRTGVRRVSGHRERMSLMFRHDDLTATEATPRPVFKLAA